MGLVFGHGGSATAPLLAVALLSAAWIAVVPSAPQVKRTFGAV